MTKTQRTGAWHGVLAICIAVGFAAAAAPGLKAQITAACDGEACGGQGLRRSEAGDR